MGDDRPKKSWRELDQAREKGRSSRDRDDDGRRRAERSGAYGAYKAQLDKMFTPGGGGLPEHLKAQLGPTDEATAARQRASAEFKDSPSDASMESYLEAGFELPDDARFLMSTFDRLSKEENLRAILARLLQIVESGKKPNRMLLLQRLTMLERSLEEPESLDLLADLRDALG